MTPQVRYPTPHHHQQPIRIDLQAVAHEASHFDRAARLDNHATRRWRTGCQPPRITTQQVIRMISQVVLHIQLIQYLDTFQQLINLTGRVLGRWRPQPALRGER
jgi:hypothetical protein